MDTPCCRVREWNPSYMNGIWELEESLISSPFPKSLLSTDGAVGTIWPKEHPYLNSHWRNTWPVSGKILGVEEWPVQTVRHRCFPLRTGRSPFPTGCHIGHHLRLPGGLQGQPVLQPTHSAEVRERAWAHNQWSTEGKSELLEGKCWHLGKWFLTSDKEMINSLRTVVLYLILL